MKAYFQYLLLALSCVSFSSHSENVAEDLWRGLVVAPESRCSDYNKKKQYPYRASLETDIIDEMDGKIYGPYSGSYFSSAKNTDIEHIVAAAEGHDSGLCDASTQTRKDFASDLLNLTLASPKVNRCSKQGKCDKDAASWLPEVNQCWYANRVVMIKRKYSLTVDDAEKQALESILSNCSSVEMVFYPPKTAVSVKVVQLDPLALYDENENGKISCAEARLHGIAPVLRAHAAYKFMNDANDDGVVCN
ncbi:GmrSD restriction endonuclease domain-containing protein [Vibrio maritimus]